MSYIGGSPNSPNLSDVINVEEDEVLDIFLNNEQNDFGFNKVLMQDQTQEVINIFVPFLVKINLKHFSMETNEKMFKIVLRLLTLPGG